VAVREQLALEEEKIREILADLTGRGLLDEVMIISTCNRVEVYGVAAVPGEARTAAFGRLGSHRGLHWRDLEPLVYTVTGDEAALHAFRVAASLDSMILGEPQILGQVKDAFALAQSAGTAGPVLHALMTQAFAALNAALRQLANRLVGILHGCLRTRTKYSEAKAWLKADQTQDQSAA